jgi:hypothetical protein
MAIKCSGCNREYDVTLFEFEKTIKCACGGIVTLQHRELFNTLLLKRKHESWKVSEIKKLADKIAFLIVSTDYPLIDIEIEKQRMKEKIEELFPDSVHLYGLIYEPRFKRLVEQFRGQD